MNKIEMFDIISVVMNGINDNVSRFSANNLIYYTNEFKYFKSDYKYEKSTTLGNSEYLDE